MYPRPVAASTSTHYGKMVKSAVEYTMAKNLIASWHLVDNIAKWVTVKLDARY